MAGSEPHLPLLIPPYSGTGAIPYRSGIRYLTGSPYFFGTSQT